MTSYLKQLARANGPRGGVIAVALIVAAAVFTAILFARSHAFAAELFRIDPDRIAGSPGLVRRADDIALPAYRSHCASCHGVDMRGGHGDGVPDLLDTDSLYGRGRVAEIEQTVLYGIRSGSPKARNLTSMPAFARPGPQNSYKIAALTPGEIADVTAYLLSMEGARTDAAASARGVKIYGDKGLCYDCHGDAGAGDPAIGAPNLTDHVWLYGHGSTADIRRTLTGGRAGVCPAWVGKLSPVVIRSLAVMISTRAHEVPMTQVPR